MENNANYRLHAVVEGRVQGVGFRAFVVSQANRLSLTGWVRNCWDGSVEVVAEGGRSALDQLLGALKRGPSGSLVSKVTTQWLEASGEYRHFTVKYMY